MSRYNVCKLAIALIAMAFFTSTLRAQQTAVPYGNNPAAGHYLQSDDARIYYEIYGSGGTPLVLLHGGLYGYIEEFGDLIAHESKHREVIAIATRGHGKSEIGKQPFSYELFAKDALAVIHHETSGKIDLLGFSDGAITSYVFASGHPELIEKLVAIGGPRGARDWTPKGLADYKLFKPADVERDSPQFVAARKKLMPEPQRWNEFVERITKVEVGDELATNQQIRSIQVPTLIMAGDHDDYNRTEAFVEIYWLLPKGQLSFIPGCGHVVLDCKAKLTIETISGFLDPAGP
jgi:pimeloyl-ACP methyl ester carboxylesterase